MIEGFFKTRAKEAATIIVTVDVVERDWGLQQGETILIHINNG